MIERAVSSGEAFVQFVAARRGDVDAALDRVLPAPPECPANIADAMRYAVTSGGKRFRPLLTLAAAEAVASTRPGAGDRERAGAREQAMPAACAIELLHTQSLVHDDLPSMDDDCLRRGRPTLHMRVGEGMAILAGDGLLAVAFSLLADAPEHVGDDWLIARKLQVISEIGRAVGPTGMVGGQAIDLACAAAAAAHLPIAMDLSALRDMHQRKTGGLIRAAAVSGAIMAGGSPAQVRAIGRFSAEVGVAFQIVDDLLDVNGGVAIGKTPGKDVAAGKPTYPALVGCTRSRALAEDHVARAEQLLADAGLVEHHLMDLARWVITRRC